MAWRAARTHREARFIAERLLASERERLAVAGTAAALGPECARSTSASPAPSELGVWRTGGPRRAPRAHSESGCNSLAPEGNRIEGTSSWRGRRARQKLPAVATGPEPHTRRPTSRPGKVKAGQCAPRRRSADRQRRCRQTPIFAVGVVHRGNRSAAGEQPCTAACVVGAGGRRRGGRAYGGSRARPAAGKAPCRPAHRPASGARARPGPASSFPGSGHARRRRCKGEVNGRKVGVRTSAVTKVLNGPSYGGSIVGQTMWSREVVNVGDIIIIPGGRAARMGDIRITSTTSACVRIRNARFRALYESGVEKAVASS